MRFLFAVLALMLAACDVADVGRGASDVTQLDEVAARVLPVAAAACLAEGRQRNCNFDLAVEQRPNQPANAYQSVGADGRPVLTVNTAMLAEVRNADELALVLAHEAAHHIEGHIDRLNQTLARMALRGERAGTSSVRVQQKAFELAADALGARIAADAGFDVTRAARIIARLPDPGAHGSATHPARQARLAAIATAVD